MDGSRKGDFKKIGRTLSWEKLRTISEKETKRVTKKKGLPTEEGRWTEEGGGRRSRDFGAMEGL